MNLALKNRWAILEQTGTGAMQVQPRNISSQQASWHFSETSEPLKFVDASLMSWTTWNRCSSTCRSYSGHYAGTKLTRILSQTTRRAMRGQDLRHRSCYPGYIERFNQRTIPAASVAQRISTPPDLNSLIINFFERVLRQECIKVMRD